MLVIDSLISLFAALPSEIEINLNNGKTVFVPSGPLPLIYETNNGVCGVCH